MRKAGCGVRGAVFLAAGFLSLCAAPVWAKAKPDDITVNIDRLIRDRGFRRADVGVHVVSITHGDQIYARNADRPLMPASNMKLITTAAALDALGTCYTFPTTVYIDRMSKNGVVEGNLYIKGYGDPFLTAEEMWRLVRFVCQKGLKEVKGDIIADDSYFDQTRKGNGWRGQRNNSWYDAQIGALSCNFNTVEVNVSPGVVPGAPIAAWLVPDTGYIKLINQARTTANYSRGVVVDMHPDAGQHRLLVSGGIPKYMEHLTYWRTISDPPMYTATVFRDYLIREGVKVGGAVKAGVVPSAATEYYTHSSKPLAFIIRWLNKMSNNFVAEQILKTMGAQVYEPPGTDAKGLKVVEEFLKKIGVNTANLTLADGSGLSPLNHITPRAVNQVLSYMYKNPALGPEYVASLAVMGQDGTVHRRLINTEARGMIRAKTGTITGVASLSGYAPTKDGEMLAFSIILNGVGSNGRAHNLQDKICLQLMNFSRPQGTIKAQR